MKCKQNGFVAVVLVIVIIVLFLLVGWILNIVKLCDCDFQTPAKEEVVRIIGIFVAPVGGIIGWIDISDGQIENKQVSEQ